MGKKELCKAAGAFPVSPQKIEQHHIPSTLFMRKQQAAQLFQGACIMFKPQADGRGSLCLPMDVADGLPAGGLLAEKAIPDFRTPGLYPMFEKMRVRRIFQHIVVIGRQELLDRQIHQALLKQLRLFLGIQHGPHNIGFHLPKCPIPRKAAGF